MRTRSPRVLRRADPQSTGLVAERIAVDSQRLSSATDVALVMAQGGQDQLALELVARLRQSDSASRQFFHNRRELTVETLAPVQNQALR